MVQREGAQSFAPADAIDPEYGRLLRDARAAGVKVRALGVRLDPQTGAELTNHELTLAF